MGFPSVCLPACPCNHEKLLRYCRPMQNVSMSMSHHVDTKMDASPFLPSLTSVPAPGPLWPLQEVVTAVGGALEAAAGGAPGIVHFGPGMPALLMEQPVTLAGG